MNRSDIKKLQDYKGYPSISILVPTHRTMPERLQDPIRVKDAIRKAFDKLLEEFEKRDVLSLVEAFEKLASSIDYTKTLDGLALFVNKDIALLYYLPFAVDEKIIIDAQFATKEMNKALNRSPYYWILSLSEKPTRLFRAVGGSVEEVIDDQALRDQLKGFPFELNYEVTSDRKVQAVSEGSKDARYLTDLDIRFMQQVDDILARHLHDNYDPIVLLGTQNNRALFEKTSKVARRLLGSVEGDFSKATADSISAVAVPVLQDYLKQERAEALNVFAESIGKNLAVVGLQPVWRAAKEGRVRTLLVEEGYHVPGVINPDNTENLLIYEQFNQTMSNDLIDELVDQVLNTRARVIFVPAGSLKDYEQVAAILRF